MEFYNNLSSTMSDDRQFETMITGVWNLDFKEDFKKSAGVVNQPEFGNSRAAFNYDMHRSVFGNLNQSPMKHKTEDIKEGNTPNKEKMPAAGMGAW